MDATRTGRSGGRQHHATRAAFLIAGVGVAAWAPLVPYVKARLGIDEAALGALLLCIGLGSLAAMPATGMLVARFDCRTVILAAGAVFCAVLPFLAILSSLPAVALALALFGAGLGTLDVAMNIHAVIVERGSTRPLMSGFHGLYSAGGIAGAGGSSLMLWLGVSPPVATFAIALALAAILAAAAPHLIRGGPDGPGTPAFVLPHGIVVLLGALCFVVFLTEGAVLDWGALLLVGSHGFDTAWGGLGYAVFAAAMTLGRFTGDRIVHAAGALPVLVGGGLCTSLGFLVVLAAQSDLPALAGFGLVGLGTSNIVPILFSAAGRQRRMPSGLAVAVITTAGYAGVLAGPALLGFVAEAAGLGTAFAILGVAMLAVPLTARIATR